jgi:hypothetical protein
MHNTFARSRGVANFLPGGMQAIRIGYLFDAVDWYTSFPVAYL